MVFGSVKEVGSPFSSFSSSLDDDDGLGNTRPLRAPGIFFCVCFCFEGVAGVQTAND